MCTESQLHRTINGLVAAGDPFSTFHLLRTYGRLGIGPVDLNDYYSHITANNAMKPSPQSNASSSTDSLQRVPSTPVQHPSNGNNGIVSIDTILHGIPTSSATESPPRPSVSSTTLPSSPPPSHQPPAPPPTSHLAPSHQPSALPSMFLMNSSLPAPPQQHQHLHHLHHYAHHHPAHISPLHHQHYRQHVGGASHHPHMHPLAPLSFSPLHNEPLDIQSTTSVASAATFGGESRPTTPASLISPGSPTGYPTTHRLMQSTGGAAEGAASSAVAAATAAYHSLLAARHRQRGEKRPIPVEQKDDKYFERRKRNNEAAKKSRDARKMREDRIAFRAAVLEQENAILRSQVVALRDEVSTLRQLICVQSTASTALPSSTVTTMS